MLRKIMAFVMAMAIAASLAACSSTQLKAVDVTEEANSDLQSVNSDSFSEKTDSAEEDTGNKSEVNNSDTAVLNQTDNEEQAAKNTQVVSADGGVISAEEEFTDRDLRQEADISDAEYITLESGEDITITAEGVYVLSGTAQNTSIIIDAQDEDKVQLVLNSVSVTNDYFPCIYVKNADKVFVTTTDSVNTLAVNGSFITDGDTNTDAAIFSKDDLVLNGLGTLEIISTENGVTCKDDLKVTGGTISISCTSDGIEANDSVAVAGGSITIETPKDGIHAENDEDDTLGYVLICGGTFSITASDDGIHGTTVVQIDDGDISIIAKEGIEGTYVQINGGSIYISASDDGINAASKSSAYRATAEINGGYITLDIGAGDTDAVDSNGDLYVNGGTLDISANSPFDYDGTGQYNGGTIIINGVETNAIYNSMMGGFGGMGGMQTVPGGMQTVPGGMQTAPGGMQMAPGGMQGNYGG